MKSCSYCGRKNEDDATFCCECGLAEFDSPTSSMASTEMDEPESETPDPDCDVPAGTEAALCTYCVFPNLPDALWCKRCGAPISWASIVGPQDVARASGSMWRGAVRGRPKRFVLASVWLLFLPGLCVNLLSMLLILRDGLPGVTSLFFLWLVAVFGATSYMMLYQVTRNFVRIPPIRWGDSEGASERPAPNNS